MGQSSGTGTRLSAYWCFPEALRGVSSSRSHRDAHSLPQSRSEARPHLVLDLLRDAVLPVSGRFA